MIPTLQASDLDEASEKLHMLPLVDFPGLGLGLDCNFLLPGGRTPAEHHLFPNPPTVPSVRNGCFYECSDAAFVWLLRMQRSLSLPEQADFPTCCAVIPHY